MSANPLDGFICPHCSEPNKLGYTVIGKKHFVPAAGNVGVCDNCTGVFEMTGPKTAEARQPEDFGNQAEELRKLQNLIRKARRCYRAKHN